MSSYQNSHRHDTALPVRLTVQVYQRLESVVEVDLLPWHPADLVVDSLHHLEQKVNIFLVEVIGCSSPWGSWRPRPPLAPHPTSCSRSPRGHPRSSSRQTLAVAIPWLQPAARPGGDISDRMRDRKFSPRSQSDFSCWLSPVQAETELTSSALTVGTCLPRHLITSFTLSKGNQNYRLDYFVLIFILIVL